MDQTNPGLRRCPSPPADAGDQELDRGRRARDGRHDLAAAFALDALDALDERERRQFTRHLRGCPACAAEVRRFREVATALAFAASAEPPPELHHRVMTAATRASQLSPRCSRRPTSGRCPAR
jgi:hypothetical protein